MSEAATILVVDNDRDLANGTARRLVAAGYRVIIARNGGDGIRLAIVEQPDAILLDPRMPPVCGSSILGWLAEHPPTAAIPLVIFTTDRPMHMVRRRLKIGAHLSIAKPYEAPQLLATIRAVLDQPLILAPRSRQQTLERPSARLSRRIDSQQGQAPATGKCLPAETLSATNSPAVPRSAGASDPGNSRFKTE